jgi:transposase
MIGTAREVYVASVPIDLRLSFDRLAAIVRGQFGDEPRDDALFIFFNRQRTHVKILARDASGLWIHDKRLSRGTFRVPLAIPPGAARVRIERRELDVMLDGIDTATLRRARRALGIPR